MMESGTATGDNTEYTEGVSLSALFLTALQWPDPLEKNLAVHIYFHIACVVIHL